MDLTMRSKLLPAPLLIEGFVRGEKDCSYEQYMLEVINSSKWFAQNHPGEFMAPISEAHGECDAANEDYSLDFKLLASKTALQARSILSPQVEVITDGVAFYSGCKVTNSHIRATRLYALFRGKTLEDLNEIRNSKEKKYGVDNDLLTALKVLETHKNLLLFFPYEFTFDTKHEYNEAITSITEALNSDFHVALEYRKVHANSYDTFLACIYCKEFLIFKIENQKIQLCDSVKTNDVATFSKLTNYVEWWD